jgi:hypothetical protein
LGDRSHGPTIRPFERARCDLLGNYANGGRVASKAIFKCGGCIVVGAFELPDGVAGDVKLQGDSERSMPMVGMLTTVRRLRNFEFHLG